MAEVKHTPWEVGQHPAMSSGWIIRPVLFGSNVRILPESEGGHVVILDEKIARLIAAAPDLFEAGAGLLKAYRSAVKMCGDDALDLVADHPESWASKMEAALSKATTQQEGR